MAQLTPADLLARLGVPQPQTMDEYDAVLDLAIQEILKTDNKSGYRDVYKSASTVNPWQAKPYIRPKVQRNLGSFPTAEEAAKAIIIWMFGGRPTPPTPQKERNKRGEGRRQRDRRNKGKGARRRRLPHRARRLPFSQSSALGAGGVDLRTSDHRPKKAKRALQALTPEPAAVPQLVACVATTGGGSAAVGTPIHVWVDGVEHTSAGGWE